jgi:predicted nucleic acid-binding protein
MSLEFVDTNVLIYAHDGSAGAKHQRAVELLTRLVNDASGAISIQVLSEFYAAATRKLSMNSQAAEEVIRDLGGWIIHRPDHAAILRASALRRRYKTAWWDALILASAIDLGCTVLWSEDLTDGQSYGSVKVRDPFG